MKLYIDTNVIMDAIENRNNLFGKNIGNFATKLFEEALGCKYHIIISSWTMNELLNKKD